MGFLEHPKSAPRTLRVLARLVAYPDAELRAHLPAMRDVLHAEAALGAPRLSELDALIEALSRDDALDTEGRYVQLFDSGRSTALHLFEHVHGDSRDRGPAMIDLAQTYEQAGMYLAPGQLPDYLTVVLEFVSSQPAREAHAFLGEFAHILNAILDALRKRGSPYAAIFNALLELAGERPAPVKAIPDPPLDEAWAEPEAFDGCSTRGQARADQAQPIHIVRRHDPRQGALT
jgi:nitrate reductase delta subunit